ncbi:MAG TPA: histidinol-phosphatase [Opitutaceae bacterium]|nr:histidinol-phosphatase [Opitutaceae bacterium]
MNLDRQRTLMVELAVESGAFIRPLFGQNKIAVETKADLTPVTVADRGAEELMRAQIKKRFPEHGIVGEEFGSERADAEFVWMLDPIDGTKSFISGVPLWGTLIALLHHGQPILGCIHQPILGQLLLGDGITTTLNGRAVRTRACARLADATLLTSDTLNLAKHQNGAAADRLAAQVKLYRTWGDCYGYLLIATGHADVMLDPIMNPWDIAALVPIVRGAGGTISDWQGGAAFPAQSTIACATPDLHAQVVALLNEK